MYRLKREIIIIWYKTKTEWTKNWMSVRGRQQGQEQWWKWRTVRYDEMSAQTHIGAIQLAECTVTEINYRTGRDGT